MPRGYPNKPAAAPAPEATEPAIRPLIIVSPTPAGVDITAYGLAGPAVIDVLRRCLLHLVAQQNGATVISASIPNDSAILAGPAPNGAKPTPKPAAAKPAAKRRKPAAIDLDDTIDLNEDIYDY